MSRSSKRSDPEENESKPELGEKVEQLTDAVRLLADQVEVLRNVLDELRSNVWHGVLNNKFVAMTAEERSAQAPSHETEVEDEAVASLAEQVEALQDTLDGIREEFRDDLADAIHEQTKEMKELRHSLEDFTTDVEWAVRRVRNLDSHPLVQSAVADPAPSVSEQPGDGAEEANRDAMTDALAGARQSFLWSKADRESAGDEAR